MKNEHNLSALNHVVDCTAGSIVPLVNIIEQYTTSLINTFNLKNTGHLHQDTPTQKTYLNGILTEHFQQDMRTPKTSLERS
jgi:hypothetical protein